MKRLLSVLSKAIIPCVAVASVAAAAVPNRMPYQGRLTDGAGNPINGSQTIEFSIYDAAEAGTLLYTQTEDVTVQNGLFNVNLGPLPESVFNGQALHLAIKVGSDAEMTPRQLLGSVPYAFRSGFGPTVTQIRYSGSTSDNSISFTYELHRNVGSFTKNLDSTDIELTWNGHATAGGGGFCEFQLRIDNTNNGDFAESAVLYVENGTTEGHAPVSVSALFRGLAAGTHTVSIWHRGFTGVTTFCQTNNGNFRQTVWVREVEQAAGIPSAAASPEPNPTVLGGFPTSGDR